MRELVRRYPDDLAAEVERRFQKAWANTDIELTASCF